MYNLARGSVKNQIEGGEEILKEQEKVALDMAPPWKRAYAQISIDTQKRLHEIQQALADTRITSEQAAQLSALAWADNFTKTRNQLANDLQSLFNDVTSGNIGQRFKKMFEDLVFRMVATWILGMGQMRAASAGAMGSGGGILGAIFGGLGSLFGFGGGNSGSAGGFGLPGIGPGGTAPFSGILNLGGGNGSSGGGSSGGLAGGLFGGGLFGGVGSSSTSAGISALGGPSEGGIPIFAGGSITAPGGGIASLLGKGGGLAGLAQLQMMGGLSLIGLAGKAGPFGGAALGALGGALTTGALMAMFPALIGVLGAATLGIGIAVGAIVGLLMGIFGSGAKKKAVKNLEAQLVEQISQVVDAYNNFKTDFPSANSSLESLRKQYNDQMHKLGGDTKTRVHAHIDVAEAQIKQTEAERQRRAAIAFGPAEFHTGGFVHPGLVGGMSSAFRSRSLSFDIGGEVPAILHSGEFVVQQSAVNRIGRGNLEKMNAGASGGGEVHFHISALDAKSFEAWLDSGGGKKIVNHLRRGRAEGRF